MVHVMRREDGHVVRKGIDLEAVGQRRKGCQRALKKQVDKERVKVGLRREDVHR